MDRGRSRRKKEGIGEEREEMRWGRKPMEKPEKEGREEISLNEGRRMWEEWEKGERGKERDAGRES